MGYFSNLDTKGRCTFLNHNNLVYILRLFTYNSQLSTTLTNVPAFSCVIYGQNLEIFSLPVSFQAVKILIFEICSLKGILNCKMTAL